MSSDPRHPRQAPPTPKIESTLPDRNQHGLSTGDCPRLATLLVLEIHRSSGTRARGVFNSVGVVASAHASRSDSHRSRSCSRVILHGDHEYRIGKSLSLTSETLWTFCSVGFLSVGVVASAHASRGDSHRSRSCSRVILHEDHEYRIGKSLSLTSETCESRCLFSKTRMAIFLEIL